MTQNYKLIFRDTKIHFKISIFKQMIFHIQRSNAYEAGDTTS